MWMMMLMVIMMMVAGADKRWLRLAEVDVAGCGWLNATPVEVANGDEHVDDDVN